MCTLTHKQARLLHTLPLALSRQIAPGWLTIFPTMHLGIPSAPLQSRSRQTSLPLSSSSFFPVMGSALGAQRHKRPSLLPVTNRVMAVGKSSHQEVTLSPIKQVKTTTTTTTPHTHPRHILVFSCPLSHLFQERANKKRLAQRECVKREQEQSGLLTGLERERHGYGSEGCVNTKHGLSASKRKHLFIAPKQAMKKPWYSLRSLARVTAWHLFRNVRAWFTKNRRE